MKTYAQAFPRSALYWIALATLAPLCIFGLVVYQIVTGQHLVKGSTNMMGMLAGVLAIPCGLWMGRDLFAYLFGQRRSVQLDDQGIAIGGRRLAFDDIEAIVHDRSADEARIRGRDLKFTLRESLYPDFDELMDELYTHTHTRMLESFSDALGSGPVAFGKKVTLRTGGLQVGRQTAPFEHIKKIRTFATNEDGAVSEELVVELLDGKRLKVDTKHVENLLVLIPLVQQLAPNLKAGL